jgi:glycosyltransferase involved in cell wall biosynthesis
MRILMIAPECFLLPRGTPLSILGRLRAMSRAGHRVDLVTYPIGEDVELSGLTIHRVRRLPTLSSIKVGPSWTKLVMDVLVFLKALALLCRARYDLVHSHEEAAFFGAPLARLFRARHLYDMHSSLPQQLGNFEFSTFPPLVAAFRWLERTAIRGSDAIIGVYPELVAHARAIAPGRPAFLIENPDHLDGLEVAPDRIEALRHRLGLVGRPVVVYTGGFQPYQGLDLLLESAGLVVKELNDVVFLLVGGTEQEVAGFRARVAARQLTAHVILTGMARVEEVPPHLAVADVLVSPRVKGTNTPLKIYSYLRLGVPIVATELPTHQQVLDASVAVLTPPTPAAFSAGILRALLDRELRVRLGENAKRLAAERYSYAAYLARTQQALAAVA